MLGFKELFDKKKLAEKLKELGLRLSDNFRVVIEKSRDLAKTNFELGKFHFYKHNLNDAIMRFKIVKMLNPKICDLNYFLARCYEVKRDKDHALDLYVQILQSEPKNTRANFRYSYLSGKKIDFIPLEIMEENADYAAHNYNVDHKEESAALKELINELVSYCHTDGEQKVFFEKILDLGCNTGICGELLTGRFHYKEMALISISERMLDIASALAQDNTGIYTSLVRGDLNKFLNDDQNKYGLIIASNALSSYSQIDLILQNILLHLCDNGIAALLLNDLFNCKDEFNAQTMEFAVSKNYVESVLSKLKARNTIIKTTDSKESVGKIIVIFRR